MPLAFHLASPLLAACFSVLMPPSAAQSPRSAQKLPCVVEDIDTPTMPACVIQARSDALYIPKKYWMHSNFNRYGLSAFTIQSFGRVYINRSGRIVIRDVALMDNGPDDFHHGLVRINRDQMWGFADPSGRIVVPVKYSCALNHRDQYQDIGPVVCVGCRPDQQGEYNACLGGEWFHVDSKGHLAPARSLSAEASGPVITIAQPAFPLSHVEGSTTDLNRIPSTSSDDLYRVGGRISAPILLSHVEAEYTDEAREAHFQGTVVIKLTVDRVGNPQNPHVMRALGMGLDEKAMDAVRKYKFKPAMLDGNTPVPVKMMVKVDFRL